MTHQQISDCARKIWLEKGCPPGKDAENWREAEDFLARLNQASGCAGPVHHHPVSSDSWDQDIYDTCGNQGRGGSACYNCPNLKSRRGFWGWLLGG